MTPMRTRSPLPPEPVTSYFDELRRVGAPPDLVESVVAEIESQRQPARFQGLWAAALVASLAVIVAAALAFLGPRLTQTPTVGTTPQPTPSTELTPEAIAEGRLARLTDPGGDIVVGSDGDGRVPDLRTVSIDTMDGELVFHLEFARAWADDPLASVSIVIADPDTVPPNGPRPGSRAPYCSEFEGPYAIAVHDGAASLHRQDWETDLEEDVGTLPATIDGRQIRIAIPPDRVAEIVGLASGPPRLSFSISTSRDEENGEGYDLFPDGPFGTNNSHSCQTVELAP